MSALSTESRNENAGGQPGGFITATTTHSHDSATVSDDAKVLFTWQARFAMHRHSLYQVKAADGATAFLVTRWGMVRELANLDEVAKFFALIGGKI